MDCELDLFRVVILVRAGECGTDGRDSVSEDIGEEMLEMTCVGVKGVWVNVVSDWSSVRAYTNSVHM